MAKSKSRPKSIKQFKLSIEETLDNNPKVRDVLILLAGGAILGAFVVFPGLPLAFASQLKPSREKKYKNDWKKYNPTRLRHTCKRLKSQKLIKIVDEDGIPVVKLTQRGKTKVLKYNLEEMTLNKGIKWDGKWRLIIYDVPTNKKYSAETFRYMLRKIKCFQLQKSVYLTPYPCHDEIAYLREVFDIGDNVLLLKVSKLENEDFFRQYFNL